MKTRPGHEGASIPGIRFMSVKGNVRSIASTREVVSECYPMSVSSYLLYLYVLRVWASEGLFLEKAEGDTPRPQVYRYTFPWSSSAGC